VAGAVYDAAKGGLLVGGGSTVEALVGAKDTATASAALAAAGIAPAAKSALDVTGLLTTLDPKAGFFGHDKLEGVAVRGGRIVLSNDSDFGIDGVVGTEVPYRLRAKVSPVTGRQDDGEFLVVDPARLPARTATATVTVTVRR
jgi:hypothetical protein